METRRMPATCVSTCFAKCKKERGFASGLDRRVQIPNSSPKIERPAHTEVRQQVAHWFCDSGVGSKHKQAIVAMVERKSGYAVMSKVSNKNRRSDWRGDHIKAQPVEG